MTEFTPQQINQTRGPAIKFKGMLIAENTTNPKGDKDRWQQTELWETEGGAWIAVLIGASDRGKEYDILKATVIEPGADEFARQCAVMDALDWTPCARVMVRKLKWRLVQEVA